MIYHATGIHAREWVAPSTVMFIIETLLGYRELQHSEKVRLKDHVFKTYFYIIGLVRVIVDRGHLGVTLNKYGKIINHDAQFYLQCLDGVCNRKPINFPQ